MRQVLVALVVAGSGCDQPADGPLCDGCVLVEGFPAFTVITSLAADRDGGLVAAVNGVNLILVARMDRSGVLDPAFGEGGTSLVPSLVDANAIVAMPDGSIRVGGESAASDDPVVIGFTADGREDGLRLAAKDEAAGEAAVYLMEQGGSLVVAYARNRSYEGHLVRYTAAGARDPAFPPTATEWATAIAPDGRFVMAGAYSEGDTRGFLARRVTRDGAPDPSFAGGTGSVIPGVDREVFGFISVAPSAAGGLILAGVANPAQPSLIVARLDAAGQLDPSFGGGRGFAIHDVLGTGGVVGLVEAADRGIVVVGAFGVGRDDFAAAIRLAPDGSLDPAFGDGGVVVLDAEHSVFTSVVAMANGEIVAGGQANQRPLLARFPAP